MYLKNLHNNCMTKVYLRSSTPLVSRIGTGGSCWRIVFDYKDGNAYIVVAYEDYHHWQPQLNA